MSTNKMFYSRTPIPMRRRNSTTFSGRKNNVDYLNEKPHLKLTTTLFVNDDTVPSQKLDLRETRFDKSSNTTEWSGATTVRSAPIVTEDSTAASNKMLPPTMPNASSGGLNPTYDGEYRRASDTLIHSSSKNSYLSSYKPTSEQIVCGMPNYQRQTFASVRRQSRERAEGFCPEIQSSRQSPMNLSTSVLGSSSVNHPTPATRRKSLALPSTKLILSAASSPVVWTTSPRPIDMSKSEHNLSVGAASLQGDTATNSLSGSCASKSSKNIPEVFKTYYKLGSVSKKSVNNGDILGTKTEAAVNMVDGNNIAQIDAKPPICTNSTAGEVINNDLGTKSSKHNEDRLNMNGKLRRNVKHENIPPLHNDHSSQRHKPTSRHPPHNPNFGSNSVWTDRKTFGDAQRQMVTTSGETMFMLPVVNTKATAPQHSYMFNNPPSSVTLTRRPQSFAFRRGDKFNLTTYGKLFGPCITDQNVAYDHRSTHQQQAVFNKNFGSSKNKQTLKDVIHGGSSGMAMPPLSNNVTPSRFAKPFAVIKKNSLSSGTTNSSSSNSSSFSSSISLSSSSSASSSSSECSSQHHSPERSTLQKVSDNIVFNSGLFATPCPRKKFNNKTGYHSKLDHHSTNPLKKHTIVPNFSNKSMTTSTANPNVIPSSNKSASSSEVPTVSQMPSSSSTSITNNSPSIMRNQKHKFSSFFGGGGANVLPTHPSHGFWQGHKRTDSNVRIPPSNCIVPAAPSNSHATPMTNRKIGDDSDGHLAFMSGDVIGSRFQIMSTLGEGTFGKVAKVKDLAFDVNTNKRCPKYVALKIIRNIHKYREAAKLEVEVLKKMNILDPEGKFLCVKMYESFIFGGHMCLTFEILGESVFDFLKSNHYSPYPMPHVRHISAQLCHAVAFMHSNKLTHTDLKPENILFVSNDWEFCNHPQGSSLSTSSTSSTGLDVGFDSSSSSLLAGTSGGLFSGLKASASSFDLSMSSKSNGKMKGSTSPFQVRRMRDTRIKLIDFGSSTFDWEHHSSVVSTRHYRAPEVILELGWNQACDVWSIGCIIYELHQGHTLFQTHDNREHLAMMQKITDKKLPNHLIRKCSKAILKQYFIDKNIISNQPSSIMNVTSSSQYQLNWDSKAPEAEYVNRHCRKIGYSQLLTNNNSEEMATRRTKLLQNVARNRFSLVLPSSSTSMKSSVDEVEAVIDKKSSTVSQMNDLILKMLEYDPLRRIDLEPAMFHPFLAPLKIEVPATLTPASVNQKIAKKSPEAGHRVRSNNVGSINRTLSMNNGSRWQKFSVAGASGDSSCFGSTTSINNGTSSSLFGNTFGQHCSSSHILKFKV